MLSHSMKKVMTKNGFQKRNTNPQILFLTILNVCIFKTKFNNEDLNKSSLLLPEKNHHRVCKKLSKLYILKQSIIQFNMF